MYKWLYELLLYFGFPVILFFYFFKYKGHIFSDFIQRLGFLPAETRKKISHSKNWIWIHTASVGEVRIGLYLIAGLKKLLPGKMFLLSTVTPTGNRLAKKENLADLVIYLPLDFRWIVRKVLSKIRPLLLVLVETELWPNFIQQTKRQGAKIVLVNGRISKKSFQRYKFFSPFIRQILSTIDFFAMREVTDAERIITLGAPVEKVKVTGNMKYDLLQTSDFRPQNTDVLYKEFGFKPDDLIWVCGSTREGEEEIILGIYLELLKKYTNLKLILAPRHLERVPQIENLLRGKNISFIRKTELPYTLHLPRIDALRLTGQAPYACLLWDTYGELMKAYALATVVFVGGSLVPQGGHNILEPAALGKPVIFGPYVESFQEIAEMLISVSAGIQVKNAEELKIQILNLLNSSVLREEISSNAAQAVRMRKGAVEKNIELIKTYL